MLEHFKETLMNIQIKSLALGFLLACLSLVGIVIGLILLNKGGPEIFRDQVLPSGKRVKVTSCLLAWGVDHSDRHSADDCFTLEYVSSIPASPQSEQDREALEVFELIRPISELWGFDKAQVSAFPSIKRKGAYNIYVFQRAPDGKWTFDLRQEKVFIND
jgi:hypothetical protein